MNLRFTNRELPVHSRTGLRAIGFTRKSGRVIWPVLGASPDDDSNSEEQEEESPEEEREEEAKEQKNKESNKDDDTSYSPEEVKKLRLRMRGADQRADRYRKELDALKAKLESNGEESKKGEENNRFLEEKRKLEETLSSIQEQNNQLKREVAFLRCNDVSWHDPEDALRMIDLSEVDVDEDGNVDTKALRAALKDLAKRKPHLVKPSIKEEGDKEEDEEDLGSTSKSGNKMAGKRKGSDSKKVDRETLAKKYPVLRRL